MGNALPRATLADKIAVLDVLRGPPALGVHETYLRFAREARFAFSQATLANWVLQEPLLRAQARAGGTSLYKRKPVLKHPQLTAAVERHIRENWVHGQPLSDKELRGVFRAYVKELGVEDAKLSAGMLHSFKRRNGIYRGRYLGTASEPPIEAGPPADSVLAVSKSPANCEKELEFAQHMSLPTLAPTLPPAPVPGPVPGPVTGPELPGPDTGPLSVGSGPTTFDLDFAEILSSTVGFNTRLIHSDDNLGFLNLLPEEPQGPQGSQGPQGPQLSQGSQVAVAQISEHPFNASSAFKRRRADTTSDGGALATGAQVAPRGNPNCPKIEKILETITEGHVSLYNSGTSAIMGVLSHINPRHVFVSYSGYSGTHRVISLLEKLTGLTKHSLEDLQDAPMELLEHSLVILESPQNPLGYVHDLGHYARLVGRCPSAKLLVDSTLAPPPLQLPFKYGADFIVYSAVKYLAGVSDLSAGFVVCGNSAAKQMLHSERLALGTSIATFDSFLLLRSLRTYRMRITTQCLNTKQLVRHLVRNSQRYAPIVTHIHHSSLQPNADVVLKQLNGYYNPVFAIELREQWMVHAVLDAFKFLSNNPNLEGGETLVETVDDNPSFLPSENKLLLRFSVGCEDFQDIIKDLDQALDAVLEKA